MFSFVSAETSPGGVYQIKIGDFTLFSIQDTAGEMSSKLINNGEDTIIKALMPEGKSPSSNNFFILKSKKQITLIDAGRSGNIVPKLKKVGVSPENVDLILITHGHFDHVSGLLDQGKTVFPRARVLFHEKEKALYEDSALAKLPENSQQHFKPTNQVLRVYGKRIGTFVNNTSVADGITSIDLHGHTAGHSGFLIESKGEKLLVLGDFLHIDAVQFAYPDYSLIYDSDPNQASITRKDILNTAAKDNLLIAGIHIQFPGIGKVANGCEGYVFMPLK